MPANPHLRPSLCAVDIFCSAAAPSLVVASLEAALAGVDVVVAHPLLGAATAALCEARGIPWVLALLLPVFQTASFPDVVVCGGGAALACLNSPRLNCASYALLGLIFWRSQRTWAAPLRIRLGLPPAARAELAEDGGAGRRAAAVSRRK